MRLKKLKLAGFKSFVDPTTLYFPSNIVGVVGPNGCGKSNIIDAIRWVTGESSAKYMRTESMAEVIFNGSVGRNPAGQASVEMVFDNAEGTLGGEFGHFAEIAIKRVVEQDGQSTYYLNGSRCRRKDITDVFLGTGLGPRSYAIIEQGTISRFIEAKPEEIRVFLEEAAGISKYKERRRETENRIQHTRDNLVRIEDLRQEMGKQLERLQKQAKSAERYKILREDERRYQLELQALRWQSFNNQLIIEEQKIQQQDGQVEIYRNQLIELDEQYQTHQQNQHIINESYQQVQQRFYQVGSESARIEENIRHQQQQQSQLKKEEERIKIELKTAENTLEQDQQKAVELTALIEDLLPQTEQVSMQLAEYQEVLNTQENTRIAWQQDWDKFNTEFSKVSQELQVDNARLSHLEKQLAAIDRRIQQLETEQQQSNLATYDTQLFDLQDSIEQLTEKKIHLEHALQTLAEKMIVQRDLCSQLQTQIEQKKRSYQDLQTQYVSLDALQKAVLGKDDGGRAEWLKQNNFHQLPKLVEQLEVESGWEKAVEVVLADYLQAICVDDMAEILPLTEKFSHGELSLLVNSKSKSENPIAKHTAQILMNKVSCPWPSLQSLLTAIYVAEDVTSALTLLPQLQANESVITRCGIWINQSWLRIVREQDKSANDLSVIQRQQKLKQLTAELSESKAELEELQQRLATDQSLFADIQQQHKDEQNILQNLTIKFTEVTTQHKAKQEQHAQAQQRQFALQQELEEQKVSHLTVKEDFSETEMRSHAGKEQLEQLNLQKNAHQERRDQIEAELRMIRNNLREHQENKHHTLMRLEASKTQQLNLQTNVQRMQHQQQNLQMRLTEITQSILAAEEPLLLLSEQHHVLLEQCAILEKEKQQTQQQLTEIERQLKQIEQVRQQQYAQIRALESQLEQIKLEAQSLRVKASTIEENVLETGTVLADIIPTITAEAELSAWQQKVEELAKKIQNLGAVNLAAVEEYEVELERKTQIDTQANDLITALEMLEDAIRKIDIESKQLFQETFNKINSQFSELFPRLFGGGKAELVLTEDNWLKSGVMVMAHPPGKKNSSIHMLSGGEKALTALALVFAIFQLNPAPFCMLDEVDAPLDEANVGRFCKMIEEMSKMLQFIIVTHNKSTMELAHQLTGVTMHEPGVSRIVAVDVAEAISLAEMAV